MDGVREFLSAVRDAGHHAGHLRALLHVTIGRRISRADDGRVLTVGATWRQVAGALKLLRWDREQARELGLDPEDLPPRDRQRYWYAVIMAAGVDSAECRRLGDEFIELIDPLGFTVGPAPGSGSS